MTVNRIECPRCGQDWLLEVRLVYLNVRATLCPECDALWVARAAEADNFEDYGTFMRGHGRVRPEDREEIEIVGPARRA